MQEKRIHTDSQPIPDGFQIFEERLDVAGVQHHKQAAAAFAKAKNLRLELEPDPNNKFDPHAIRVIGCTRGFYKTKRECIGHVDKDTAEQLAKSGFVDKVRARLVKTYVSNHGFVEIAFQILGPAGEKSTYEKSLDL